MEGEGSGSGRKVRTGDSMGKENRNCVGVGWGVARPHFGALGCVEAAAATGLSSGPN